MARREKKPVHKVVMTEGKRNIIQQLLQDKWWFLILIAFCLSNLCILANNEVPVHHSNKLNFEVIPNKKIVKNIVYS